jgi:hypothetical protein
MLVSLRVRWIGITRTRNNDETHVIFTDINSLYTTCTAKLVPWCTDSEYNVLGRKYRQ